MKKYILTFIFYAFLTLTMSGQQFAEKSAPEVSTGVLSNSTDLASSRLISCDGVLSNYTNSIPNTTRGATSQNMGVTKAAYNTMAADDFVAPGTGELTICEVYITGVLTQIGFSGDSDSEIVLRLFENDGGLPGTMLYSESFPGTVDDNNDGSFVLELAGGPALTGGTKYWLSVQAKLDWDLAGLWYWSTAADGNGEVYAWQNPLDGFDTGCIIWTPFTNCSLTSQGPDLMMDITFNESLGTNSNSLEKAVSIYPNPAKDQFSLQSNVSLEKMTIYDVQGRIVSNVDLTEMSHEKTVDISSLASGVYIVRITSDNGSVVKNLVKQ